MENQNSIPNSIFERYPEIQWIIIGALGLSIIFQFLFYVYFFCSFKRNYSRNLTLKSYRKQKHEFENSDGVNSFFEDDGGMFTSDDHTIDLPQRNINPKVEARSKRIANSNYNNENAFPNENRRKIIHESQLRTFKFDDEPIESSNQKTQATQQKGLHKNPPPFETDINKHFSKTKSKNFNQNQRQAVKSVTRNDIKIDNIDTSIDLEEHLKEKHRESIDKQNKKLRSFEKDDLDMNTTDTSIDSEDERIEKIERNREPPRKHDGRRNPVQTNKDPTITILNEKRDNSKNKTEITKTRTERAHKKKHSSPSKEPLPRQINKSRKLSPAVDLYEVYFDKDLDKNNKENKDRKTNIQKIKFKRRSPSIESF